jgi:hypothetical protein
MSASRWRGLDSGVGKSFIKSGTYRLSAVLHLPEDFTIDRPFGLPEDGTLKAAIVFRVLLGVFRRRPTTIAEYLRPSVLCAYGSTASATSSRLIRQVS